MCACASGSIRCPAWPAARSHCEMPGMVCSTPCTVPMNRLLTETTRKATIGVPPASAACGCARATSASRALTVLSEVADVAGELPALGFRQLHADHRAAGNAVADEAVELVVAAPAHARGAQADRPRRHAVGPLALA